MLVRFDASSARRAVVFSVLAISLLACGGPSKPAAAPDSNPWADYKGTYAEPGGARPKAAKADAPKESVGTATAPLAAADAEPQAPTKAKAKRKAKAKSKAKKAPSAPES